MKLDEVANSGNDEFYTPPYAIFPLLKYIPAGATVWCPFDTKDSHFVRILSGRGNTVVSSHISSGQDFFTMPVPTCDYIVSNPPYSRKSEVLSRLFEIKAKFAMLVGVVGLFESQRRFEMFRYNDFEIMYLNKRVAFFKDFQEQSPSLNPPFSSAYIARGLFPSRIIFETIDTGRGRPARLNIRQIRLEDLD